MTEPINIESIKKMNISPGDMLVIRGDITMKQRASISRWISAMFPGTSTIFLDKNTDISIMSKPSRESLLKQLQELDEKDE